jgi:mRNA interferase RelE/StbE
VGARISRSLKRLSADPLSSPNVRALTGGGYRSRVGDWRVVFTLEGGELLETVIRIAHRREAYR